MLLSPGTRIGAYEVTAPLGAGGMGEVYRATDSRLKREVALKVLPAAVAADAERLARFQREAEVLAALNHPNIAHIHGLEESDGLKALVMELVEGEDLSQRIARGPVPIDEALRMARQIAEALEAAHEQGIVHRDLKPANIKVRADGTVKVLDFGLAKALDAVGAGASTSASMSPTITSPAMTQAGMILGTAAYMSPEQAKGRPVDKRADIWAFGVVLYEMLTGTGLFAAESVSEVLAAVLRADIDLAPLPAATPDAIRHLIRRCLDREPKTRLRDIGEARLVLDAAASPVTVAAAPPPGSRRPARVARAAAPWVAGAVLGALVVGLAGWSLGFRGSPSTSRRFRAVTSFAGVQAQPVLSPDGRSVAFVSNRDGDYDIYVGLVSGGALIKITHDPNLESRPSWSADGASIAYARLNDWGLWDIWQVPALGGTPRRLILNAADPSWSRDGRLLAYANATTRTIWVSDPAGQHARALTTTAPSLGEEAFYGLHDAEPRFSPDGRELAYVTRRGGPYGELSVVDVASGQVRQLTHDGALAHSPSWSGDGRHVYYASSRGGTMNIWKIAARGGEPEQITAGQGDDVQPHTSSDGARIVFATYREKLGFAQLDLAAGPSSQVPRRLDIDAARNQIGPAYAPDGNRLAYFSNFKGVEREAIWVAGADGTQPVLLVQDGLVNIFPRWTADGAHLVYKTEPPGLGVEGELRRVSVSGGTPVTVVRDVSDGNFDLGPDGRLLFRARGNTIQSYDPSRQTSQQLAVSSLSEKGWLLRWSPDGHAIAYIIQPSEEGDADAGLWVEDLQAKPRQVFRGWVRWYARGPGGDMFLLEGKPDLHGVLWKVGWDGAGLTRLAPIPLVYSYWAGSKGLSQNYIDVSPDGRRVIFGSLEVQQANIGMIENVGCVGTQCE